ncbi:MAG TPA: translocation/assembly module TamB domain-containing protein, partial [Polyangiales bacterium]|nr:translocation/assembly module TamB domain-containing protein [Polyangiales bacterium]
GDRLQLDLALSNDEARLLRGRAQFSDFALASLLPPSATGARVPGRLTAQLEFSGGGLGQPERMSGRLHVDTLELGAGPSALRSKSGFELRVSEGQLQLQGAVVEGWGQSYRLSTTGSLGQAPRLIADGSIDAGMFTRDSQPLLAAFGELGVHLEWSPGESPALRGRGELRELAVRAADTDVRKLRGQLVLHGDQLRLERLTAELGGGQVTLAGAMKLDGLRVASYQIDIQAAGVALEPQPLVQVTLDADTRLGWSGSDTPKLTGRIKLKRALYGKQLHLDALAGLGSLKGGRPGRDRVLFDLLVEHEGPLRVRNSAIDGELALVGPERALHVLGSDQRLGMLGELAVTRGRLSFQGDQYNVTQGHVAFGDPQRIAPKFELRAVADRRKRPDAQIVFSARGTRDAFAIDVRCDAGPSKTTPAPFKCAYAGDQLRCDDWNHLVATYVCRTP